VLVTAFVITGFVSRNDNRVRYVKTEILETSAIQNHISCSGELSAYRSRSLGVAGYAVVDRIYVNIGDTVEKGQILLTYSASADAALDTVGKMISSKEFNINETVEYIHLADTFGSTADGYLTAPFSGVVTAIEPKEGEQLSPLSAAIRISDTSRMTVKLRVYENDLHRIRIGMPVTLSGGTFEGTRHGVITAVSPSVKSSTSLTGVTERYGEVTAELTECDGLIDGASVDARISISEISGAVLVPYSAVSQDDDGNEYVYVINSNRAVKRIITTAEDLGSQVRISSGLKAGECIILESPETINEGETVYPYANQ